MNDPLLLFYAIFDSELKFMMIDLLEKNGKLDLKNIIFLTGREKKIVQQALWDLQNDQIIEKIDEHLQPFFKLSTAGRSAWLLEAKIKHWGQSQYY